MMQHGYHWMGGMHGWGWVIGVLIIVLLVVLIIQVSRRKN